MNCRKHVIMFSNTAHYWKNGCMTYDKGDNKVKTAT